MWLIPLRVFWDHVELTLFFAGSGCGASSPRLAMGSVRRTVVRRGSAPLALCPPSRDGAIRSLPRWSRATRWTTASCAPAAMRRLGQPRGDGCRHGHCDLRRTHTHTRSERCESPLLPPAPVRVPGIQCWQRVRRVHAARPVVLPRQAQHPRQSHSVHAQAERTACTPRPTTCSDGLAHI
jgi:hypothetical protein